MKRISKRLLGFLALTFILTGIATPHAHANLGGSDTPSKYAAVDQDGGVSTPGIGTEFFCEFRDSARVYCWRDATPGEMATGNGDQNKGTNSEKTFWYDPAKSKAAGHDVFIPDNGAKISEYGYLHFPESASGNYRLAQVSTNATDGSNGLPDNDVNTTGIKTPAANGVCSIALFKDGESHKCTVGTKGGNVKLGTTTVTTNIKTGYSEIDAYEEANKKCDKGGLGFVLCPIRDMMLDTVNTLNEWLASLLDINTDGFLNPTLMEASRNVLTLANSFYALIFLVIIFANAFSIGLDSYALKKMVPRLVAAIILSQFAFFITGSIIEIGNILGRGVSAFFLSLAPETASRVGGGAAVSLGILSGLTILVLLLMIMIVIIAFLVVLAILALRWATLYALILIAPLAFAAKVLPNTDKLFKSWWTNLIKLVMMFPIIMAITSGAAFLSSVMISSDSPFAIQIVGALLPFLGFLMIPKAFKWSGGIMAATGGKLSSWAAGKTKSAAKDTWSKEGGYKDRLDKASGGRIPTTLGPISNLSQRKRLEVAGTAADRVQKAAEAGSGQAKRIIDAMPAGDATGTPVERDQFNARQDRVKSLMKDLKTPEAQSKFVASLAKSGKRTEVETARSSGIMSDDTWNNMVSSNFDSFDGMADMRNKPSTATSKYTEHLQKLTAESFTKGNADSQKAWAASGAFGLMDAQQVALLGDQGVRSKINQKALSQLAAYKSGLGAKAAYTPGGVAGPGVRTAEEEKKFASLSTWIP